MRLPLRTALTALLLLAMPVAAEAAPALWQVSDADSKIWLFGSIHVLPPDTNWRTPAFDDALRQADLVYFEADIGPLGQLGILLKGIQMGFGQHDPWLTKLTPEQSAKLTSAIAPLGLTTAQLGGFAPWLASAMIENAVMKTAGFDGTLGVDSTLQAELPKERKAYFETASGQMDMLATDPLDRQIQRLMLTLDTLDKVPDALRQMVGSWSSGDTDGLADELTDDPSMDQSFVQTMLFDRNAAWVTTIEQLLAANHQDLIVVGAAHLVGDGSVLARLAQVGFTVQRIQ
ncbi:MAG: TraB/GumN family protein [Devosia sp.]